ncbi:hypothetical protein [Flavobacterium sp. WC2430]|jgi:predicted extracellular nuclease|uniref:Lipocalin-like domain-containing protein n=1 Tax=Flavobacterium sp. WC2416 TaxID=3234141 RepID=A0AB39WFB6_9FLAO
MKIPLIYFALIFTLFSCSTSESTMVANSIVGKWDWVQSSGGITGETTTPSSTNKSMSVEISKSEVKTYENGNLTTTESYSIQAKESIFGGKKPMLVYLSGKPSQSFSVEGAKLFLSDECYDCYQIEYVKQ